MVFAVSVSAPVDCSVYITLNSHVTIGYPDWIRFPHGRMALGTWIPQVRLTGRRLSRSNRRQWSLRRPTSANSKGQRGATLRAGTARPLQESTHSLVQPRPRPGGVLRLCGDAPTFYRRPRQEGGYDGLRHGDPADECLECQVYSYPYGCHAGSGARADRAPRGGGDAPGPGRQGREHGHAYID